MGDERKTILIIEDDAELARLIARVLQHEGYSTVEITNPREALQACEDERPGLIFADLMMPYMDGEMFVLRLRARLKEQAPPVVLVSGSASRREIAERLDVAATVSKPFEMSDIVDVAYRFIGPPPTKEEP